MFSERKWQTPSIKSYVATVSNVEDYLLAASRRIHQRLKRGAWNHHLPHRSPIRQPVKTRIDLLQPQSVSQQTIHR